MGSEIEERYSMDNNVTSLKASYWQIFRMIFVIFFVYLLGDAFYRWDGFRYYGSFFDFLPSIALITILWTTVTVIVSLIIWCIFGMLKISLSLFGIRFYVISFVMCMFIFILFSLFIYFIKMHFWPLWVMTLKLKIAILISIAIISSLISIFLSGNKSIFNIGQQLAKWVYESITPLVWLFGIWFLISIPLVAYHAFFKSHVHLQKQLSAKHPLNYNNKPNIILLTFDALRKQNMSVYGYSRQTTPFIRRWSTNAFLFTNVKSASNATVPTTSSLMTGKRVWTHRQYYLEGFGVDRGNLENLAIELKKQGYYTMAFIQNTMADVKRLGVATGFDVIPNRSVFVVPASLHGWISKTLDSLFLNKIPLHNWFVKEDFLFYKVVVMISQRLSETNVPPQKVFDYFFKSNYHKPYFVWIHLLPPHSPYLPPEPYMGMFDQSYKLRTFKSQVDFFKSSKKYNTYGYFPKKVLAAVDTLKSRYDEYIRFCDKEFENFILEMRKRGMLKDTIIIVSSDHGESFEHGYLAHEYVPLYGGVTDIPLIIKMPGQVEGRTIRDLVEQIDIPATILDLAGAKVPQWMEGRSLVPLLKGLYLPPKHVFSMVLYENPRNAPITKGIISIWEGHYKLIYNLDEGGSQLFNVAKDPGELNNLFDKETAIGYHLLAIIQDKLKKINKTNISERHKGQ